MRLKNWRFKPNTAKTVHCIFHLNNRQTSLKLNLKINGKTVEYAKNPTYRGVILVRSLTYRYHAEKINRKLKSIVNLVQRLADTTQECTPKTLRNTTQAMIMSALYFSMNEQCTCKMVDSTKIPWLHVISNSTSSHKRREKSSFTNSQSISNRSRILCATSTQVDIQGFSTM